MENSNGNSGNEVVAALVYDFLQYKLNGDQYLDVPERVKQASVRPSVRKVANALRSLADEFSSQFGEQFAEICNALEVDEDSISGTIEGVANELFGEGITWARIVSFFVFGSELAIHSKNRNWCLLIDIIAVSLSSYICKRIVPWVNDHGGWEGLVIYNDETESDPQSAFRLLLVRNHILFASAIGAFILAAAISQRYLN